MATLFFSTSNKKSSYFPILLFLLLLPVFSNASESSSNLLLNNYNANSFLRKAVISFRGIDKSLRELRYKLRRGFGNDSCSDERVKQAEITLDYLEDLKKSFQEKIQKHIKLFIKANQVLQKAIKSSILTHFFKREVSFFYTISHSRYNYFKKCPKLQERFENISKIDIPMNAWVYWNQVFISEALRPIVQIFFNKQNDGEDFVSLKLPVFRVQIPVEPVLKNSKTKIEKMKSILSMVVYPILYKNILFFKNHWKWGGPETLQGYSENIFNQYKNFLLEKNISNQIIEKYKVEESSNKTEKRKEFLAFLENVFFKNKRNKSDKEILILNFFRKSVIKLFLKYENSIKDKKKVKKLMSDIVSNIKLHFVSDMKRAFYSIPTYGLSRAFIKGTEENNFLNKTLLYKFRFHLKGIYSSYSIFKKKPSMRLFSKIYKEYVNTEERQIKEKIDELLKSIKISFFGYKKKKSEKSKNKVLNSLLEASTILKELEKDELNENILMNPALLFQMITGEIKRKVELKYKESKNIKKYRDEIFLINKIHENVIKDIRYFYGKEQEGSKRTNFAFNKEGKNKKQKKEYITFEKALLNLKRKNNDRFQLISKKCQGLAKSKCVAFYVFQYAFEKLLNDFSPNPSDTKNEKRWNWIEKAHVTLKETALMMGMNVSGKNKIVIEKKMCLFLKETFLGKNYWKRMKKYYSLLKTTKRYASFVLKFIVELIPVVPMNRDRNEKKGFVKLKEGRDYYSKLEKQNVLSDFHILGLGFNGKKLYQILSRKNARSLLNQVPSKVYYYTNETIRLLRENKLSKVVARLDLMMNQILTKFPSYFYIIKDFLYIRSSFFSKSAKNYMQEGVSIYGEMMHYSFLSIFVLGTLKILGKFGKFTPLFRKIYLLDLFLKKPTGLIMSYWMLGLTYKFYNYIDMNQSYNNILSRINKIYYSTKNDTMVSTRSVFGLKNFLNEYSKEFLKSIYRDDILTILGFHFFSKFTHWATRSSFESKLENVLFKIHFFYDNKRLTKSTIFLDESALIETMKKMEAYVKSELNKTMEIIEIPQGLLETREQHQKTISFKKKKIRIYKEKLQQLQILQKEVSDVFKIERDNLTQSAEHYRDLFLTSGLLKESEEPNYLIWRRVSEEASRLFQKSRIQVSSGNTALVQLYEIYSEWKWYRILGISEFLHKVRFLDELGRNMPKNRSQYSENALVKYKAKKTVNYKEKKIVKYNEENKQSTSQHSKPMTVFGKALALLSPFLNPLRSITGEMKHGTNLRRSYLILTMPVEILSRYFFGAVDRVFGYPVYLYKMRKFYIKYKNEFHKEFDSFGFVKFREVEARLAILKLFQTPMDTMEMQNAGIPEKYFELLYNPFFSHFQLRGENKNGQIRINLKKYEKWLTNMIQISEEMLFYGITE